MEKSENNQKKLRFHAEVFDKTQFLFQEYNDHQVRAVIYFDGMAERELLEKAVRCSADFLPILGSRFVPDKIRPYWESIDEAGYQNLISFTDMGNKEPENEIQAFITGKTDECTGAQLMVKNIRAMGRDTLCIVMNHMICDGAGFKQYIYLLGEIYTKLQDGTYEEFRYYSGSRSERQIYRHFSLFEKLKVSLLPNESTKNRNTVRFPLCDEHTGQRPVISTHKLSRERFERLKAYGKNYSVTINDIVLAAYFRALNQMLDHEQCEVLTIPCMVDLRRYLPDRKAEGICNLTSMIACHIGATEGESFRETVSKVSEAMSRRKNGYPGLNGLSLLKLAYKLPFAFSQRILKKHYANPMIGLTNIGILDSNRLVFGSVPVRDAYVAASVKYTPYFQMGLTTYKDSITFTVSQYCTESDRETIQRFFSLLDQELSI